MRIELKDVRKSFDGVEALRGVSLTIPAGRKVALIGPNGSGKTTLTRILMGLLACSGEVLLDGCPPFSRRAELAARLAYVPQTAPLMSAKVREIVGVIAVARGIEPRAIASTAWGLGLDCEAAADVAVRELSGGMRQKLMLALALSARADLFILDEPTASLDSISRQGFFHLYEEIAGGATLILCSHRLEEIQHLVDQVVALESGKVVFDGPVAEFLDSRTVGIIEVYTRTEHRAEWLSSCGFSRGASGAWARTVSRAEKVRLLGEIAATCGGEFANIIVRDVEYVDPARGSQAE
ncbi:MAG: ABC transporter ATP-binding protein [Candidatus Binataceae bacterium]